MIDEGTSIIKNAEEIADLLEIPLEEVKAVAASLNDSQ